MKEKFNIRLSRVLLYLLIIIIPTIIFFLIVIKDHSENRNKYFEESQFKLRFTYETVLKNYSTFTNMLFESNVNKKGITKILHDALSTKKYDEYRKTLFEELTPFYKVLRNNNIRQLHFQLPNNESFLRFHRPDLYGDDLTGIRSTIEYVNKFKKPVSGFEEGRIFNGFRYVYPLFYDSVHVGSVEISYSFNLFNEVMVDILGSSIDFVLSGEVINRKVFEDELGNYEPSKINPDFMNDKSIIYKDKKYIFNEGIYSSLKGKELDLVKEKMKSYTDFYLETKYNDENVLLIFYPLENALDKKSAYLITVLKDPYKTEQDNSLLMKLILSSLFAISALFFLLYREAKLSKEKEINNKLRKLNREKDKLFSIVSHDLRSPFTAILSYVRFLHSGIDAFTIEEIQDSLKDIQTSANRAFTLLENLLEWSRLQLQKVKIERSDFNLKELINQCVAEFSEITKQKGIKINTELEDINYSVDKNSFIIAVRNIINNAIKFSHSESLIEIKLSKNGNEIFLSIKDYGVGMPPEKIKNLLEDTIHESTQGTNLEKGSGLGFELIKEYVILNNGKLNIKSQKNEGTEIIITFK